MALETEGVTVEAVTHGKVSMHRDSYVIVKGTDNTVAGIVYHGGGDYRPISLEGTSCTVYNCVVEHHDSEIWVVFKGIGNTLRNCRFSEKTSDGVLVDVHVDHEYHSHTILNNVFQDHAYADGDNGHETIRLMSISGDRKEGLHTVEGNHFLRCNGEIEIISSKSSYNTFRNNAFEDNRGFLTLRSKDNNIVEGNVFVDYGNYPGDAGGVRIYAKNHVLRDNWFFGGEGCLILHNTYDGHEGSSNITMESNTMVNCKEAIHFSHYDDGETVEEPLIFRNNFVSNTNGEAMIDVPIPAGQSDFSGGNYFYGENLGLPEGAELPAGLVWEPEAKDLGNEGLERFEAIKCKAGPSWEQTC